MSSFTFFTFFFFLLLSSVGSSSLSSDNSNWSQSICVCSSFIKTASLSSLPLVFLFLFLLFPLLALDRFLTGSLGNSWRDYGEFILHVSCNGTTKRLETLPETSWDGWSWSGRDGNRTLVLSAVSIALEILRTPLKLGGTEDRLLYFPLEMSSWWSDGAVLLLRTL